MKKINIAVLGCGRIGQMHARNIALHEMTSLACVYDINEEFDSYGSMISSIHIKDRILKGFF